jgi:hypothetical protein
MVRTLAYVLLAIIVFGTVAVPGLGAFALLAAPLVVLALLWRVALTVVTRGRATDAVVHTRSHHFLGPGGPDDSFAHDVFDEGESPAPASRTRPTPQPYYTRDGARPRISVPPSARVGAVAVSATSRDDV